MSIEIPPPHRRPPAPRALLWGTAGALLILAAPALAQGTPAQRAACTPDALRLCSSEIPDAGRVAACLRRERSHLSAGCQQAMGGPARPVDVVATGSIRRRSGE